MIMLEDDLRDLFGARVQAPPAAVDPAGTAIRRGRARRSHRRMLVGSIGSLALIAVIAGLAVIKGAFTGVNPGNGNQVTYEAIFGGGEAESTPGRQLPIIDMPIDVHEGAALFTSDGRRLTLPGVEQVIEVVRVPQGWLYSDDFRLRLLTLGGQSLSVRDNLSSWTVSDDGGKVATVSTGTTLALQTPSGGQVAATPSAAAVTAGTKVTGFDGQRVVLMRPDGDVTHWSGGQAQADQNSPDPELLAVYGSTTQPTVGLIADGSKTCLAELTADTKGWLVRARLGCAELFHNTARAGTGLNRATRSADGRWLAVPSPTGVHLVDILASRTIGDLVFGYSCGSRPDAPAVWSDTSTVLTISSENGVVACGMSGMRYAVALPAGVSDGWALVRRYGVNS
jgi:hypothetical protein